MKMYLINHVNLTAADIGKTEFGLVEAAFPTEVEACAHIHNTLIPHFETDITLEYIRSMGKEAFERTYHFDKTFEEDESTIARTKGRRLTSTPPTRNASTTYSPSRSLGTRS